MSHFRKALKTLEFNKITEMLADCAKTEGAKLMARLLAPESDPVRVKRLQSETAAARYLIAKKSAPSFGGIRDVADSLEKAGKHAILSTGELIEVANVLRVSRTALDYIENDPADETVVDQIFRRRMALRTKDEALRIFHRFNRAQRQKAGVIRPQRRYGYHDRFH